MKKFKILYITLYLPIENFHGGGNRMFAQIKYFSERYDIYLISFVREWEMEGVDYLLPICKEVQLMPVEQETLKSFSFTKPGFIKNYYSQEMQALIQKKVKEVDFDLVQFEYLPMAQYREGLKVKSILTEHRLGFLYLGNEIRLEKNYFKKLILLFRYIRLLRYEIKILKKFDRIIFLNNNEARYINNIKSFVSPMGVDTEYFMADDTEIEDTDLIFIGNFDNYQNIDSVIYFFESIWPLIKKKRPKTTFKIIGYNSKEKLGFLQKKDGIDVIGYVDDIRGYINRAKLYILPARIGSGMRGKLLEALSMGKSVISTSRGIEGYGDDILRAVLISDGAEDFATKTLELLYNDDLRRKMGRIGRSIAEENYRWRNIFSNMDRLYETLSEKK